MRAMNMVWLSVGLVGCSESHIAPPISSDAQILLLPAQGVSNVIAQGTMLGVEGRYVEGHFDPSHLTQLGAEVSIRTWPEGDVVPSHVVTIVNVSHTDAGTEANTQPLARVKLVPQAALAARWYAVKLGSLPAGFKWLGAPTQSKADSSYLARFFGASDPRLTGVQFDGPKGGRFLVTLNFSEPVSLDGDQKSILALKQLNSSISCTVGPDPLPPSSEMHAVAVWTAVCLGGDPGAKMTLSIGSGFSSPESKVASNLPYSEDLIVSQLPSGDGGGWYDAIFARQNPLN